MTTIETATKVANSKNLATTHGGWQYPLLDAFKSWEIVSWPLGGKEATAAIFSAPLPTLRWLKDDKVIDLRITENGKMLPMAEFKARLGLFVKGGDPKTSKRISRLFRPSLYWAKLPMEQFVVREESVPESLWDGMGWVSEKLLWKLASNIPNDARKDGRIMELLNAKRVEFTAVGPWGEYKGHALVQPAHLMGGADFITHKGAAKREVKLANCALVDVRPVHGQKQWLCDVQSLVNLHPLLGNQELMVALEAESKDFLAAIESGEVANVFSKMFWQGEFDTEGDMKAALSWNLMEYVASGGMLSESAYMTRMAGKQHLNRLNAQAAKHFRLPVPASARLYVASAATGHLKQRLAQGEAMLDFARATVFINSADYAAALSVWGGGDGDDALNIVVGRTANGVEMLGLRSPNAEGEWFTFRLVNDEAELEAKLGPIPARDWSVLPTRADKARRIYGELEPLVAKVSTSLTSEASYWAETAQYIRLLNGNLGALGLYILTLKAIRLTFGRFPTQMPASTEAVVDGTVKDPRDMAPVKEWCQKWQMRLLQLPLCAHAAKSIKAEKWIRVGGHWMDELEAGIAKHIAAYQEAVDALALRTLPNQAVFEYGTRFMAAASPVRTQYGRLMAKLGTAKDDAERKQIFLAADSLVADYLHAQPANVVTNVVAGIFAAIYTSTSSDGKVSDTLMWGKQTAPYVFAALRAMKVLVTPEWDAETQMPKAVSRARRQLNMSKRFACGVNGVWFNNLNHKQTQRALAPFRTMRDVPADLRAAEKQAITGMATRMCGKTLATKLVGDRRVICTQQGLVLGYLPKGQEELFAGVENFQVLESTADDGNLTLICQK